MMVGEGRKGGVVDLWLYGKANPGKGYDKLDWSTNPSLGSDFPGTTMTFGCCYGLRKGLLSDPPM